MLYVFATYSIAISHPDSYKPTLSLHLLPLFISTKDTDLWSELGWEGGLEIGREGIRLGRRGGDRKGRN